MAMAKKPPYEFRVDDRVHIGLDALDDSQKKAVHKAIMDRDHFLAHAADRRNVETISKKESIYAVSVPVGLRIIYKVSGEDIEILDLVGEENCASTARRRFVARRRRR